MICRFYKENDTKKTDPYQAWDSKKKICIDDTNKFTWPHIKIKEHFRNICSFVYI